MLVLAIDTSSAAVTAGVLTVDETAAVAAERTAIAPRGHGELLTPSIAGCLNDLGISPAAVGAVVVGTGPGPYTGLRVGMVTAAAFADALGIPVYGVGSLDAIAADAQDEGELIVVTDARRREVYWARYDAQGERVEGPRVSRPADVPLRDVSALAGAGAELYAETWAGVPRHPALYPSSLSLVALARERIVAGAPGELLSPLYLRRPDAVVPGAPKAVSQ